MEVAVLFDLVEPGLALMTLNRPDVRNAINEEMIAAIEQHVTAINDDPHIKALIITGKGKAFCSGGNVKDMQQRTSIFAGTAPQLRINYQQHIQRIPQAMHRLKVPAIAAVNGPAYGAGCDLAMMCDMRVAGESAVFAESFIKLGLIPGDGGAWFLPRVISYGRAAEMLFTGEPISSQQALAWGMVNRVVSDTEIVEQAVELAGKIIRHPAHAIRMSKLLLQQSEKASLNTLLEMSAGLQALAHQTHDHQEAVDAFLEKRRPDFTDN